MAKRPWVTPSEVKEYSEFDTVKGRSADKLMIDISRAETQIMALTNNKDFLDDAIYAEIPPEIKNAVIVLAEAYAHNAVEKTKAKKSETFDDYSYTAESTTLNVGDVLSEIAPLLEDYMKAKARRSVNFRLSKL